jgi:hypothetical protein
MKARMVQAAIALLLMLWASAALAASAEKERAAEQAAQQWLALVDSGAYRASWDRASGYFKSAMDPARWEQAMVGIRRPLGRLLERRLQSRNYYTKLPGAPDGQYVVIKFITSFQNKRSSIETVTPMLDHDGVWRVSGYFIK